jgi:predicted transposase/invertase (TIGR01784 family)
MTLLKRTNDLVFKMLFVKSKPGLMGMLSAVLGEEVTDLTILNPEIRGEHVGQAPDKHVVLDLRAELRSGRRVIVEMQMRVVKGLKPRLAYYAAKDLSSALARGQGYDELTPTVVIVWLGQRIFHRDPEHLHRIFELRERQTGELLGEHLAIHVLQLEDFEGPTETPIKQALDRWARFFLAESEAELSRIAQGDKQMEDAVETLKQLSQDREIARLAEQREDEIRFYQMDLTRERREGKAEMVEKFLRSRFGDLDSDIRDRIARASEAELDRLANRILSAATLSEVFVDTRPYGEHPDR